MAFVGAVSELKWFALKASADVTVRPHPRQCCNISPRRSLLNFSRAGFDGHALTCLLGPPVASLVRWELIRTKSLGRDALVRKPFSELIGQQSAGLFFKTSFLWSEFGCAQTRSTLGLQRSTVCATGFRIENRPRLPCTRGTKSTAANTRWENSTVPPFSGSLWLRREAQSSARCPVQTP
jgi:hypothetical protein